MTRRNWGRLATASLMFGGWLYGPPPPAADAAFLAAAISADGLGNLYISASTPGASGYDDAFIAKYDAAGNRQWTRRLGTDQTDRSAGVAADGLGNVYVAGTTFGSFCGPNAGGEDAFIAKYDAAGVIQWVGQLGTAMSDGSGGVAADGLGNVYIAGSTSGSLGGPFAGNTDAFIAKFDAMGSRQWTRQLGTADYDWSGPVSADGLGNVYISGTTRGGLGGPNLGKDDAFVAKYDAAGNLQWTRQLGTVNDDGSSSVAADGLGNAYIAGRMDRRAAGPRDPPLADAFFAKYDAAGNLEWTSRLVAFFDNVINGISADRLGSVYVSGYSTGPNMWNQPTLNAPFVAKYGVAGQWTRNPATPDDHGYVFDVSDDGRGNVFVSGYSSSYHDAYLAKYDAAGNLQWTRFGINIPEPASWVLAALAGAARLRRSKRGGQRTEA